MRKIFINPGHAKGGVPDPGCTNPAMKLKEFELAYDYGQRLARYLKNAGYKVMLLQSHNLFDECPLLPSVVKNANAWDADVFVSLHINAGGGHGAESLVYRKDSEAGILASCIQNELAASLQQLDWSFPDRGIKERPELCVLKRTYMPAVIVEAGFIDNVNDAILLKKYPDTIAAAIARGITDYDVGKLKRLHA